MKYRVELTANAERDVDSALRWFREQHATAASGRWLNAILARVDTLERHPARCRLANEADELGIELRELLFGKRHGTYRILFVIEGQMVNILHIRHASRSAASHQDLH